MKSWVRNHFQSLQLIIGIFFLLLLNYLSPMLTSNQENYYGLAKQYVNPNWIPNSFSFNEFVGTRYLFQVLVGYPLQFLSFETVNILFTVIGFLLLAVPLAKIFEHFKCSLVFTFPMLATIFFSSVGSGAFWGGEWIFGGFEAKTLAYVFVLWGLLFFLRGDSFKALIFTIPATYFHFLVGGYAFCFFGSYNFLVDRKFKETMKAFAVYLTFVTPFILFLYLNGFKNSAGFYEHTKSANWIYTNFRNPHHTAVFANATVFTEKILPGILKALACFVLLGGLFIFRKKHLNPETRRISTFSLYTLLILFVFLPVVYLDKEGAISKLYLFRFGAVSKFITVLSILLLIPRFELFKSNSHKVVIIIVSFGLGLARFNKNFINQIKDDSNWTYVIAKEANKISKPGSTFLFLDAHNSSPDDGFESFIRLSERDLFVSYKFIPAEKGEMLEWYQRILDVNSLKNNPASVRKFLVKYPQVDFIISKESLPLNIVSSIKHFKIYRRIL